MPTCQPSNTAAANPQEVNLSAVRTYHLFWWLRETPTGLSMDDINQRFLTCPDVGKTFSDDTICLYVNTLRQLGCAIARPAPSTKQRYVLTQHPFHPFNAPKDSPSFHKATQHIKHLAACKNALDSALTYSEHLTLDVILLRLLTNTPHLIGSVTAQEQSLQGETSPDTNLFEQARCVDYQPYHALIAQLEDAIEDNNSLLFITYSSPKSNTSKPEASPAPHYYIRPRALQYQGGALYLLGTRLGTKTHLARLRVDRITQCQPTDHLPNNPSDKLLPPHDMLPSEISAETVSFQVLLTPYPTQSSLAPLPHLSTHTSWQDWINTLSRQGILMGVQTHHLHFTPPHSNAHTNMPAQIPCIHVTGRCMDDFLLKQALLQAPYPIRMLAPSAWATRYANTLADTAKHYQPSPAQHPTDTAPTTYLPTI